MDLITILYGGSKSLLLMVMVFGAFLVSKQMNRGKIRNLFVGYLLFWALLLFLDVYNMVIAAASGGEVPIPAPMLSLVTAITSHLVILGFFYNLLFTFKRSLQIIAAHVAVVAVVLAVISCINGVETANFFYIADTLQLAYKGISTQSIIGKALIIIMQLSFSGVALLVSNKLVTIYQAHIEKNESNTAYNLLWIKEVGRTLFVITVTYIYLMVFITYTNAIIYYAILIVAYMRMINTLIQHVTLDNIDEMYDKLGVKWSWKKMWYHEEVVSQELDEVRSQFDEIIRWIKSDRPYVNPQFSFKDINVQFESITYNDFDAIIRADRGLNFQSYIRECRIDYATELIEKEDNKLLLREIAYKVGFDSSTAFSRAFKTAKGVAASEWKSKK